MSKRKNLRKLVAEDAPRRTKKRSKRDKQAMLEDDEDEDEDVTGSTRASEAATEGADDTETESDNEEEDDAEEEEDDDPRILNIGTDLSHPRNIKDPHSQLLAWQNAACSKFFVCSNDHRALLICFFPVNAADSIEWWDCAFRAFLATNAVVAQAFRIHSDSMHSYIHNYHNYPLSVYEPLL